MKNIIEKYENFGLLHGFLKQEARILIGLSGGSDSMAMTLLFREIQKKYSLFIMAAHINYHLRGEESDLDERFVKEFCFSHNIPLYILQARIPDDVGIQKAARDIRLEYFKKLKKHYKIEFIALGHQLEDQTETVLHRIVRGAGFTGLSGICPVKDDIIHPVLIFKKDELIEYLQKKGVGYRTDQTNLSNYYTRNKIRNELIPYIKKEFNPNFEHKLIEYGNLFYLSENYFKQQAKKEFRKSLIEKNESDVIFAITHLKKVYPIILFYVFREAWSCLTETDKDFYSVHFKDIVGALESDSGFKEIVLPDNVRVMKDYHCLIFRKIDKYQETNRETIKVLDSFRKFFSFNDKRFEMKKAKQLINVGDALVRPVESIVPIDNSVGDALVRPTFDKNTAILDFDKIKFPIKLRYRKDGDRFIPFGMENFKKIKNFFIDKKVPLKERDTIILFCDTEKIFWVSGFMIDQRVAISSDTKNFLYIKMENSEDIKNRAAMRFKN